MTIQLTADEETRLDRQLELGAQIANASSKEEARRLAEERNAWLTEGIDPGRLTLPVLARLALFTHKPHNLKTERFTSLPKEQQELLLFLIEHPQNKAFANHLDGIKANLLA